ncbi:hypothetical protein [Virgibacillus necropolis]|uniref:DUF3679 domain-containing protein n=1 Tax=Virgibacillus necropolis TaxID=163877 RepID=A0A221MBX9_9BACI|nr:hypothetical protein [Virgibacillus necropolis]ASN05178.1 hypothetical protein CFK40_09190 [Virgibacillus necropolis]
MKSIVILLLLLLFFVSGMLFGVERDQLEFTSPKVETIDVNKVSESQETISPLSENNEYKQAPDHFTQKMASFIEGIVKGFYEIIVQLLYQVVQLFY